MESGAGCWPEIIGKASSWGQNFPQSGYAKVAGRFREDQHSKNKYLGRTNEGTEAFPDLASECLGCLFLYNQCAKAVVSSPRLKTLQTPLLHVKNISKTFRFIV